MSERKAKTTEAGKVTVAYLKCPFYLDNPNRSSKDIKCESVFEKSDICIRFDDKTSCRHHKENFCASDCFVGCPQYQLLMEIKYNDKYSEEVQERSNLR